MGGPSNITSGNNAPQRPSQAGGSGSGGGFGSGGGSLTQPAGGSATAGGGSGGSNGAVGCPEELVATTHGANRGLLVGTLLAVTLDASTVPPRVMIVDPVSTRPVGAIGGVPNLARLIECLAAGVTYRAVVTLVDGGRTDLRIVRQAA